MRTRVDSSWIPGVDCFSRQEHLLELSALLLMERNTRCVEREQRARRDATAVPLEQRMPSSPFHFVISRVRDIEPAKLDVVNRLMRLVPHHGVAFLMLFAEKKLVPAVRLEDPKQEHTRRYLRSDTNAHVYEFSPRITNT